MSNYKNSVSFVLVFVKRSIKSMNMSRLHFVEFWVLMQLYTCLFDCKRYLQVSDLHFDAIGKYNEDNAEAFGSQEPLGQVIYKVSSQAISLSLSLSCRYAHIHNIIHLL